MESGQVISDQVSGEVYKTYAQNDWSYQNQAAWSSKCFGSCQSPIDINYEKLNHTNFPPLKLKTQKKKYKVSIVNNGHSVQVKLVDPSMVPTISGGSLSDTYILDNFHFHWKSEHTVDGKRFPLEIHFVNYNKKYENLSNALNYKDGVSVLGAFYEINDQSSEAMSLLTDSISLIEKNVGKTVVLKKEIWLEDFLPKLKKKKDVRHFVYYEGSLTTPDCNEVVSWIILTSHGCVTKEQLHSFTKIQDQKNERVLSNFRDIQELNSRTVYTDAN